MQTDKATKARKKYEKVKKTSKLGSGKRFAALSSAIQAEGKSKKEADAISAAAGRKKYTNKKISKMAKAGREK